MADVKPIFIYNTAGDWLATALGTYIFDTRGEYIGFLDGTDKERAVYTRDGEWVGRLSKDGRILRKRVARAIPLHSQTPAKPSARPSNLPGRAPLPPQNAEISYDTVDVLEEDPDVFKRLSDRRKDLGE